MATKLQPVQDLDFAELKESLKDYLKNQNRFKDYDFDGSNMSVLLDILAYNGYYNTFYYNMAIAEGFLDSAQQRNSVISHAKELNYLPRSRRSSRARINLTITDNSATSNFLSIPKGCAFAGRCGNQTYTFITDKVYTGNKLAGTTNTYLIEDMDVYEGRLITEFLDINNTTLSNEFVDIRSVEVKVYENASASSADIGDVFNYRKDIFGTTATDNVFYLQPEADGKYSLQFGEDTFGRQPIATNVIRVTYRITSGEQANGVRKVNLTTNLGEASSSVVMPEPSSGGAYAEDIESIRKFAPKSLQVQERAVTKQDYEVLLKQRFPNIQAISVYGGDEVDPPRYGKVVISVDVQGGDGASDFEVTAFRDYLANRTPLTIEPVFVAAKFMYVDMDVSVTYDPNLTSKSASEIRSDIRSRILEYQEANLNDFNITLRQSNITAYLDSYDPSIVSTDIKSRPIIEYIPRINVITNPSFSFVSPLMEPYLYSESTGFLKFNPALTSTTFTLDGSIVSLQDNGSGEIIAVVTATAGATALKQKIGTIDYTTGHVALSNFVVEDLSGDAIKFYADTQKKDITAPKDRILSIRDEDIRITVNSTAAE